MKIERPQTQQHALARRRVPPLGDLRHDRGGGQLQGQAHHRQPGAIAKPAVPSPACGALGGGERHRHCAGG